ncbi:hypothetical protein D3C86_1560610 [compost metagenome]
MKTGRLTGVIAAALLGAMLAGCDRLTEDPFDASALIVARYIQDARAKCDAAGAPELWECAEIGREHKEAWLAARTALSSYETFKSNCYEAAGMTKCEALIEKALLTLPRQ